MPMKTYELECPNCGEALEIELDPASLVDDAECIECPNCAEECEWEYDGDTLTLVADDLDDEDEEPTEDLGLTCEDNEEDPEDEIDDGTDDE